MIVPPHWCNMVGIRELVGVLRVTMLVEREFLAGTGYFAP
jgi:hypothetical protein